ncbi:MAG: tetratricopeptide repeat protein [Bacteroidota bacterium]
MTPLGAQTATAEIEKLNKQALDAYDGLSFDQAKTLLEQALDQAKAAGLQNAPAAARTHLNLGMVLIAGLQEVRGVSRDAQRDEAIAHFRAALKIQPDLTPPAGLFNPEVQAVFDETKEAADKEREEEPPAPPPKAAKPRAERAATKVGADSEAEEDEDEESEADAPSGSRLFLSFGLGSGFGVAKGHLDANKDIMQGNPPKPDNSWSGGLAPSRLGHLVLGGGYFLSNDLMLSVEGRLQIVSGTTTVTSMPSCMPSCAAPSVGFAALAKANWFLGAAPFRPFVSVGAGGGTIRQVVKLNVSDCGAAMNQPCVDTVTGGPLLLAAGGGVVYEMGSLALLGSLTANVGVPKLMLNIDAVLGVGLRL